MPCLFAIRAIDFGGKRPYTDGMLRLVLAGTLVLLVALLTLVGYNVLVIGTGLVGALGVINRYWQDAVSGAGTTQSIQWMAVIAAALAVGWRAGHMRDAARY